MARGQVRKPPLARWLELCHVAAAALDFDSPFRMQAAPDVLQCLVGVLVVVSSQLATVMRLWREACCRLSYASSSAHPCPQRVGDFRGRLLTSRLRPPAPPVLNRVSTHAMTAR